MAGDPPDDLARRRAEIAALRAEADRLRARADDPEALRKLSDVLGDIVWHVEYLDPAEALHEAREWLAVAARLPLVHSHEEELARLALVDILQSLAWAAEKQRDPRRAVALATEAYAEAEPLASSTTADEEYVSACVCLGEISFAAGEHARGMTLLLKAFDVARGGYGDQGFVREGEVIAKRGRAAELARAVAAAELPVATKLAVAELLAPYTCTQELLSARLELAAAIAAAGESGRAAAIAKEVDTALARLRQPRESGEPGHVQRPAPAPPEHMSWGAITELVVPSLEVDPAARSDEMVLVCLRELFRSWWNVQGERVDPASEPLPELERFHLDRQLPRIVRVVRRDVRQLEDFLRSGRTILPQDVIALCEVRSGLELLVAGHPGLRPGGLRECCELVDDVFERVIAPGARASPGVESVHPAPPGHRWWSLVPVEPLDWTSR